MSIYLPVSIASPLIKSFPLPNIFDETTLTQLLNVIASLFRQFEIRAGENNLGQENSLSKALIWNCLICYKST